MFIQKLKLAAMIVLTVLVGGVANADLYVDPELRPLWEQTTPDSRPVVVIALFKDTIPPAPAPASQSGRPWVEMSLRRNAMASQKATLDRIGSIIAAGTPVNGIQLWLINGLILQLPVDKMRILEKDPNVKAIFANHSAQLIQPMPAPIRREVKFTYGLERIKIPELRAQNPQMIGTGARVGILDTGIDPQHPDLKDKTVLFKDFINNRPAPYDDHKHGTHVAGTVAGGEASGTAIGVAPGSKLVIGKILNSGGSGSWAGILQAMQWISDPDGNPQTPDQPQLVSNSWGARADFTMNPNELPLCKAVASWAKLGILPVVSAGNSGPRAQTVAVPAACPDAMAIGATDDKDVIANFSSRGTAPWPTGELTKPAVSAPGVAVLSSVPGGGYASFSGTSMSAPHVAGLAALVYQAKPDITLKQISDLIMTSAKHLGDPGHNNVYGMGLIDSVKTLKRLTGAVSRE